MNKFLKVFFLLIFALLLLSCAEDVQPMKTQEVVGNELPSTSRNVEEANIYSLLLNKDPKGYIGNSSTVFVFNETEIVMSSFSDDESILRDLPTLTKETLANYRETNRQRQIIKLSLSLNKPYEIMSSEEIAKRNAEDPDWFRTTLTTFSGIGFNSKFDQALVYMQHDCGGECATGDLYLLVRDPNGWRIENILEGWVS